jgi:hypothetical protein
VADLWPERCKEFISYPKPLLRKRHAVSGAFIRRRMNAKRKKRSAAKASEKISVVKSVRQIAETDKKFKVPSPILRDDGTLLFGAVFCYAITFSEHRSYNFLF